MFYRFQIDAPGLFKTFVVLLIALTSYSAIAAGESYTFWMRERGVSRQVFTRIVDAYNRKEGTQIRLEHVSADTMKSVLLRASLTNTNLPDLALVPSDYLGLHEALKLSPVRKQAFAKVGIGSEDWSTVSVGGKTWGIPVIAGNHLLLFYNRKYVDKPAGTWSELVAQVPKIRAKGAKPIGWNYAEMYWFVPFVGAMGGWPMNGSEITLNTPAMAKALTFYRSMRDQKLIDPNCNLDCAARRFHEGEIAYSINGEWELSTAAARLGKDFGVTHLPTIEGQRLVPMSATHALVFPGRKNLTQHPALIDFAKYIVSKEVQAILMNDGLRIPVRTDLRSGKLPEDLAPVVGALKFSRSMPSHMAMAFAWEGMRKGFALFMAGQMTAQQAAKHMQEVAVSAYEREKKK